MRGTDQKLGPIRPRTRMRTGGRVVGRYGCSTTSHCREKASWYRVLLRILFTRYPQDINRKGTKGVTRVVHRFLSSSKLVVFGLLS
jgi:hypothetical protein